MRTAHGTELIGMVFADYILVVVQNCTGKPWIYADDDSSATAEVAQAQ